MYLVSETFWLFPKFGPKIQPGDQKVISNYKGFLDKSTKYIPTWVKVAVALGLGTMIGWKRIVVTVGEKIGKTHMTYAQGASAELTAMCTIYGFDKIGLPVSTTHVLSSGVAGTMMAGVSGLQWSTSGISRRPGCSPSRPPRCSRAAYSGCLARSRSNDGHPVRCQPGVRVSDPGSSLWLRVCRHIYEVPAKACHPDCRVLKVMLWWVSPGGSRYRICVLNSTVENGEVMRTCGPYFSRHSA